MPTMVQEPLQEIEKNNSVGWGLGLRIVSWDLQENVPMRFFSPLAVIAAVGLSVSAPAYAHPKLVSSTPAANASVSARSEEHTSELQSLMRISYAVFCLKKKNKNKQHN